MPGLFNAATFASAGLLDDDDKDASSSSFPNPISDPNSNAKPALQTNIPRLSLDELLAVIGDMPISADPTNEGSKESDSVLSKVTREQFDAGRARKFGNVNPEEMDVPFWKAMVEWGGGAYSARKWFADDEKCIFTDSEFSSGRWSNPVWCFSRLGRTSTTLPDGTTVQIGGEHEDFYDPDFLIYNDVVVFAPGSTSEEPRFTIYGYPEDVFPPTDFHSATYVAGWKAIFVIGGTGAGMEGEEDENETRVNKLEIGTWKMHKVETTGEGPGNIWSHEARVEKDGREIWVTGGRERGVFETERYVRVGGESREVRVGVGEKWVLDLETRGWRHEGGDA